MDAWPRSRRANIRPTCYRLRKIANRELKGSTMKDKPLKSLNGKRFEGVLAEPIDTGMFMPVREDDLAWPKYFEGSCNGNEPL